jgi:hypothetical protein
MDDKIYLQALLRFSDDELKKVKIKFNQWNGQTDPLDRFVENPDVVNNEWLFWRKKRRYFNVGDIAVCLVQMRGDTWLLTTVKKVTAELNKIQGINYIGEGIDAFRPYFGRVVVKYHKTQRGQCFKAGTIMNELEVLQVLPTIYDGEEFPGYSNVCLPYVKLANVIARPKASWIEALKNQKAVYLITDTKTGKLYVGSATGREMLLQRWSNYVANGHGGNIELKKLVDEEGLSYVVQYFQYSILENYNATVDDSIVTSRESYWKKVLYSRKRGYNAN